MTAVIRSLVDRVIVGRRASTSAQFLRRGAQLVIDAYDNIGAEFEKNGERTVLDRLAPADFAVAFDVGANVGEWTHAALTRWPRIHIHGFEIAPATFRTLQERLRHSKELARVTLHNAGLSDRDGTQEMYFYPDRPDITCDMPRHDGPVEKFVATVRIGDGYLAETKLPRIDFLKIDVEGMELTVLNGFRQALSSGVIRCLQFEYGAFSIDTRMLLKDFYQLLGDKYVIGKIMQRGVDFREYHWTLEDFKFANFLAVRRSEETLIGLARGVL